MPDDVEHDPRLEDGSSDGNASMPPGCVVSIVFLFMRVGIGVALLILGPWLVVAAVRGEGATFARVGGGVVGVSLSAIGVGLIAWGIGVFRSWCRRGDYAKRLEQRAEQLGLPTEPEAYQDGGMVVAATAYGLERAELVASALRGAGIPAWVEGGATAGWYWHLQFAMHPRGIRILVPNGRLEDARAVLAERRGFQEEEKEDELAEEPAEASDPGERLFLWAKGLFILLFLSATLTAPFVYVASMVILILACRRLGQAKSAVLLKRAMRWSMVTAGIAATVCVVLVLIFTRASCSSEPRLMETEDGAIYIERPVRLP